MADTLQLLSIIFFSAAGVCLLLTIVFGIVFKIPTVIGDLSGSTAKKSIAKMRATNEKSGNKSYKESKVNSERGKVTGTMPGIYKDKLDVKNSTDVVDPETGLLSENRADTSESEATGILDGEATSILGSETTGLLIDENATAPLDTEAEIPSVRIERKQLRMIEEVIFIHTDEVI